MKIISTLAPLIKIINATLALIIPPSIHKVKKGLNRERKASG
jgi:hypothetical protein